MQEKERERGELIELNYQTPERPPEPFREASTADKFALGAAMLSSAYTAALFCTNDPANKTAPLIFLGAVGLGAAGLSAALRSAKAGAATGQWSYSRWIAIGLCLAVLGAMLAVFFTSAGSL